MYHMYNYLCIFIGGLGELVRLVRPPVTGRSALFRLRFRFMRAVRAERAVRAVRAGEARRSCEGVCVKTVVLSLGLLGARFHACGRLSAAIFTAQAHGL